IKSNQIKSNQIKSNQIKSNQKKTRKEMGRWEIEWNVIRSDLMGRDLINSNPLTPMTTPISSPPYLLFTLPNPPHFTPQLYNSSDLPKFFLSNNYPQKISLPADLMRCHQFKSPNPDDHWNVRPTLSPFHPSQPYALHSSTL